MNAYDSNNPEAFVELLKTNLTAASNALAEMFSINDFIQTPRSPDELEHRLSIIKVNSGNEGDGNYAWAVLQFQLDNVVLGYVRYEGWYSSFDEGEWEDDPILVHPKNVVVLKYLAADGSEDDEYLEVL